MKKKSKSNSSKHECTRCGVTKKPVKWGRVAVCTNCGCPTIKVKVDNDGIFH
jgi:predicted  nucleic acid-binding Zn-ribbon protein